MPTIYDIKYDTLENSPHFFDRKTLRFFGQTMRDFRVKTIGERVFIYAPSYWSNRLMGYTVREYVKQDHDLVHIRNNDGSLVHTSEWSNVERFFEQVKLAESQKGEK